MTRSDRIAILISILAVLAAYFVTTRVFEGIAHIEDEIAYVWQARVVAGGNLTVPTPPEPHSFLVPFIVDHNGQRFGKYPIGWPIVLSVGELLGIRAWINPILAGLGVWLTYRLGKRVLGETVGLLAAGLTITSPFFLMNSGSLLAHPFGLVLSTAFALAWAGAFLESDESNHWLPTITAALTLGVLVLTRPLTAVGVSIPFGLHGLYLLWRGDKSVRQRLITLGLVVLALSSLHLLWQYALTGNALKNPYTLWWEYDKIGFGPGYGHRENGHSLQQAYINTRHSLHAGLSDLFGWASFSWIFLPFGFWAIRRNRGAWLLAGVFPSLVLLYSAYWIGSWLFGPRYYYEGLYSLTLISAAGIAFLAGWPTRPGFPFPSYEGWRRLRPLATSAVVLLLVSVNLIFYTPQRVGGMFALYGLEHADIQPFLTNSAQDLTPALIIVHPEHKWSEYGSFLELMDPYLESPFVFIIYRGPNSSTKVIAAFPDRSAYHYYTEEPHIFYAVSSPPSD